MMYSISDLSKLLSVSKVTIYSKIKLKEIQPYIVKQQGMTFIKEEGLSKVRDSLSLKTFTNYGNEAEAGEEPETVENEGFKEDLNTIKDYIETLKEDKLNLWKQLEEKDKQITELLSRIESMSKLVENSQVLLKSKEDDPLLLEEHFIEFDKKLEVMKEKLENRQQQDKKTFWDKFRK